MDTRTCRFCHLQLKDSFVNLGLSPFSNSFVRSDQVGQGSQFYPLQVFVCENCLLVQLDEFESPEHIFSNEYAYYSSFSESWLLHAKQYVNDMVRNYDLDQTSKVVEIACNDGYLLQYFVKQGIPVLGIEPAGNVAKAAETKGITVISDFFGEQLARRLVDNGEQADLIIGNNVLAHVPDLNDFVKGLKKLLKETGIITMEFPHLLKLMQDNQFDTIYHEHFSYFSFMTVEKVFALHSLTVFNVEELPTHGGSLRIYVRHEHYDNLQVSTEVDRLAALERTAGLHTMEAYHTFYKRVEQTKRDILSFLINLKNQGATIVGYGAPAKGNTLFNYCGIRNDFIQYVVDRNPHKQGTLLPGTLIPVYEPERIRDTKPDVVVIMPWNIQAEIIDQMAYITEWGGRFAVFIPEPKLIE